MSEPRSFGKYSLLERIGSGGMAEIWKASLKGVDGFEKILVVKKILPKFARNRQFITMFVQEAKVTSGLHHANVVQIYELGEENGEYFIAMEFVQGCDLLKVLTRAARRKQPLPPELCVYIVTEVCKGLGYAHGATDIHGQPLNMVHLDVSPSNILLSWDGEVKLTDFGVARASIEGRPSPKDDRLKGKLGYMSPEQVTGKPIDRRSDLFSIGIILYELITLKRLFLGKTDADTLHNIRDADLEPRLKRHPEIPEPIAEIIRKALTRNVDTRYQTAFEIEEALSQYLFEQRLRVTPQHMSRYLDELFSDGRPVYEPPPPLPAEEELAVEVELLEDSPSGGTSAPAHEAASDTRVNPKKEATRAVRVSSKVEEAAYRLKSAESGVFGPIDFPNLQQLVRSRSVGPSELVSVDGQPWRPLCEVTQLFGVFQDDVVTAETYDDETGAFGSTSAARLLVRLASRKVTGRLRVTRDDYRKELYFRRGKPVHIATNRKRELFGSVLVKEGLVTQSQLEDAISLCSRDGGPLGTALVRLGALQQGELFRLLDLQFREKFISVFEWNDARYELRIGAEPAPGAVPFMLDPYPAIAEGVRRHVEPSFLEHYFAGAGPKTIRLVGDPPFDAGKLKLAPKEHRVRMALENRPTTFSGLMSTHGTNPAQRAVALFVLFLLHQTEHIRIS